MIYLDNSATTKPCREAVEAMTLAMTENWGNPSALYNFGIDTAHMMRDARHKVAAALGAEPDRVFFTSGGTEADNWAIHGTVKRFGKRGKHNALHRLARVENGTCSCGGGDWEGVMKPPPGLPLGGGKWMRDEDLWMRVCYRSIRLFFA